MRLKGFVLMERDGRYLLIKEAAAKWGGKWFLPGGSIESHETLEEGTRREVMEEAGCEVELVSVILVKKGEGFFNKKTSVFFYGTMTGDRIKTVADKESLEVRWVTYEELDGLPLRQKLKKIIELYRSHRDFIPAASFNWKDVKDGL